ncbi:endonuclease/exonuclease/phosphatase family protein [Gillisia sp. M10.2A]|uniref:Endonuclease/exonuclease/phosphatase family protein n=1 Tax=Gillisia lutea TaxID=2909668 RepID=A0ABS9EBH9_9FLAO|nr:endonuclease/exonuclease/phosphatase family protein [Gillisia lutea]MCF4100251.1 endonuclease/exonuclease/phosphatase family protein [Gillisia lutea]
MKKLTALIILLIGGILHAQELSVLTYNIKYDATNDTINGWANRKNFLISQLNFNHPDIFGIQEGLHHQLEDIKEGLPNYEYFGVGRDNGDEKGEFTAIFYNSEKVELLEQDTFWLSETPDVPSIGWDAAYKRICTYGIFKLKGASEKIIVFNTHFDHRGIIAREKSAFLVLKQIEKINKGDLPVVLMGDFNLELNTAGVKAILKKLKDTHSVAGTAAFGPEGTFNGFHFEEPVTRKIDFVFSSSNIQVVKSGILSDAKNCKYPSDHFPVYVELKLGED